MLALRSRTRRVLAPLALAALAIQSLGGCYTYARADGNAVGAGEEVAVEVTDQGRVDLAGSIGEQPFRVEGRLVARTDTSLTLAVSAVESLRGGRTDWRGESVTLRRSGVAGVSTRRFDRSRSVLAALVLIGATAAVFLGVSLIGNGNSSGDPPPAGGGGGGGGAT